MKSFFLTILATFFLLVKLDAHEDCCNQFVNDNRCGTFSADQKKIKNKIQRRIYFDNDGRPKNQLSFDSPNKLFTIHYDTSGMHKVPLIDKNNNGVPDYVDSAAYYAEVVYKIQVQEIGLTDPVNDSARGGSPGYDVYLLDLGNGDEFPDSNGIQDPGGMYGFTVNDLELSPRTTYPRYTSFMVVDNDFSATDSARPTGAKPYRVFKTTGIDALKITLAHEFNHAIQFISGFDDFGFTGIAEMLSVMFEEVCFPEVDDYLQYTRSLFKNPDQYSFAVSNPQNGYRYSIFFLMLYQKYGADFIRSYFDRLKMGINGYRALDLVLNKTNSSMNTEWMDFLKWIYHSSFRAIPGKYFTDAQIMPEITFASERFFNNPTETFSGEADTYQFKADRIVFQNNFPLSNDTLNIITSHIDSVSAISQIQFKDNYVHSVIEEPKQDYSKIFINSAQNYFYKISSIRQNTKSVLFEIPGVNTIPLASTYPNPVFTNDAKYVYFPVDEMAKIGELVELTIFNSNMIEIYRNSLPVGIISNNRVLIFNFEDFDKTNNLGTGVYIFLANSKNDRILGKFSVINN